MISLAVKASFQIATSSNLPFHCLCEASFLGVPSIFPKFGGISEFFPKTTDFSFEQFNYNDLVNKVNLLDDEKLVKQEGLNNQEFIKDYLNEAKLINTFQEIINE